MSWESPDGCKHCCGAEVLIKNKSKVIIWSVLFMLRVSLTNPAGLMVLFVVCSKPFWRSFSTSRVRRATQVRLGQLNRALNWGVLGEHLSSVTPAVHIENSGIIWIQWLAWQPLLLCGRVFFFPSIRDKVGVYSTQALQFSKQKFDDSLRLQRRVFSFGWFKCGHLMAIVITQNQIVS